jgi:hypothetical protein
VAGNGGLYKTEKLLRLSGSFREVVDLMKVSSLTVVAPRVLLLMQSLLIVSRCVSFLVGRDAMRRGEGSVFGKPADFVRARESTRTIDEWLC